MRIALGPIVIWLGCLAAASARSSEKVAVVEVSGRSTADAVLRTWSADRIAVAQSDSSVREVPLGELLAVTFGRKSAPLAAGDPLVIMANGDRLVVRPVGVFEDLLTATWHKIPSRAALKLPLETVAAIVFDLPAAADDRQRMYADLQTLPAGEDVVLLANGDRVQGEFERLDGAFLHLKTASGLLKLDRTRVHAIRMNPELTAAPRMEGLDIQILYF